MSSARAAVSAVRPLPTKETKASRGADRDSLDTGLKKWIRSRQVLSQRHDLTGGKQEAFANVFRSSRRGKRTPPSASTTRCVHRSPRKRCNAHPGGTLETANLRGRATQQLVTSSRSLDSVQGRSHPDAEGPRSGCSEVGASRGTPHDAGGCSGEACTSGQPRCCDPRMYRRMPLTWVDVPKTLPSVQRELDGGHTARTLPGDGDPCCRAGAVPDGARSAHLGAMTHTLAAAGAQVPGTGEASEAADAD